MKAGRIPARIKELDDIKSVAILALQ